MSLRPETGKINEWTRIAAQQVNPLIARFGPIARADMAGQAGSALVVNGTEDGLVFAAISGGGGGVADGDKGQIIVSGGGLFWNLDTGAAAANLGYTPYNATNPAGYTANSSDATLLARANHTGTQVMATISDLPVLASGTYTPTLTNVTNVAASVTDVMKYLRVGDVVTVSGRITIDPTAAGLTRVDISLPIASNLAALRDCAGTGAREGENVVGIILGDTTNDRAYLSFIAVSTSNGAWAVHFTYEIK